ncbi:MAG TPA: aromatic ring-hydroxylating dioxygenase subunit alpha, partial [Puia sp.]|nr:aromatic ring-hydroxylating dioxygenase subunit alpha [Puia sp.]
MPRFTVDADISRAKTLDTAFYTDPELFLLAKEKLFIPSWQFIGDASLVASPCDAYPLTLLPGYLEEPLVLVCGKDEEIRLLSNVCTHRGNIVVNEACNLTQLRCRYHGRVFDLDGGFRSMPEFREVCDFPSAADNLTRLPLESWGKWLFTSLGGGDDFRLYWGDLMRRLHWLPLDNYELRPELSRDFTVKAHWALYCENYLEGFHIPFVHAGLNSVI